jgi:hypothetical protein
MTTLREYTLKLDKSRQSVSMPEGAKCLSVQQRGETVVLWAIVTPQGAALELPVYIYAITNGEPFPSTAITDYLGTIQMNGWVIHYFRGWL